MITLTLKNSLWGIELSSDSLTKEGNIYEGNFFIQIRQRFKDRHPQLKIVIDLGDGHYDDEPSYNINGVEKMGLNPVLITTQGTKT